MSKEEWNQHVALLLEHVNEYYRYDSGLNYKQKEKYVKQRIEAIRKIKYDLNWPPFAEIALNVTNSSWGFDECYDSMDGGMERTINKIKKV